MRSARYCPVCGKIWDLTYCPECPGVLIVRVWDYGEGFEIERLP